MSGLTFSQIVSNLQAQGVPAHKAEATARRECGIPEPIEVSTPIFLTPVALPFRLTLPWSALCSDNEHEVASLKMVQGKPVPFRKMTARYKTAKKQIATLAQAAVGNLAAPLEVPLAIHVRVYIPSASHGNDSINFAKVVHDGLQGVVYRNDRQLHRVLWERAGIDIDRPRADIEITLSPLSPR